VESEFDLEIAFISILLQLFSSCSHCWVFFGVLLAVVVECNTDGNILVVDSGMI
jgi:hypothetical protein